MTADCETCHLETSYLKIEVERVGMIDIIVIAWIIGSLLLSMALCSTICAYISGKPPAHLSLVDLIYRDIVGYIFLFCASVYAGIVACITSGNGYKTLDLYGSLFFAVLVSISITTFHFSKKLDRFFQYNIRVFLMSNSLTCMQISNGKRN